MKSSIEVLAETPPTRILRYRDLSALNMRLAEVNNLLGTPHRAATDTVSGNQILKTKEANLREKTSPVASRPIPTISSPPQNYSPVAPARSSNMAVLAQHNAITDPVEKSKHYAANKPAIDQAYRELPAPAKPAPKPTGFALLDEYNAITDPVERAEWYAENSKSYDREFRRFTNSKKS